jgi:hypothetical protein
MTLVNKIRAYSFVAGVFENQQRDLCGNCKAFVNSVNAARQSLSQLQVEQADALRSLPAQVQQLLTDAKKRLDRLILPENVPGQKKAGNCLLPQGICFVKASIALIEKA